MQTKPIVFGKTNVLDFDCNPNIEYTRNITVSPSSVSARIEIYKKFASREFKNLEVSPLGKLPEDRKLEITSSNKVSITVKGVINSIETTTTEEIRPLIDLSSIDLSKNMGLSVIAEGVETQEQKDFLMQNGCHHIQGFYYSKPVKSADIEEQLKARI